MHRSRRGIVLLLLLAAWALAACAAGTNPAEGTPGQAGEGDGFLLGLWHGFIAPVTFVISLFEDTVGFYEVRNNGNWYDFGFVLGAGILFGGGALGSRR